MTISKKYFTSLIGLILLSSHFTVFAENGGKMPVADQESVLLWNKHIKNKKNLILDNFGIIEGLTLCKQGGKIDNRLAVFASTAFSGPHRTSIGNLSLSEKQLFNAAQNLKGSALSDEEKSKINKLYKKIKEAYGDRSTPLRYGTFLMGKALQLGRTVNNESCLKEFSEIIGNNIPESKDCWFDNAALKLGLIHGWDSVVEKGKNISYEKYKESIDKRVPVIIEKNGYFKLVVGYLKIAVQRYLIIVDLKKTPLEKTGFQYPPDQREKFESLPPDDPWRVMYEQKKNKKKFTTDLQVRSKMELPIGITIEKFNQPENQAYFIHDWKRTIDPWQSSLEKIIKK